MENENRLLERVSPLDAAGGSAVVLLVFDLNHHFLVDDVGSLEGSATVLDFNALEGLQGLVELEDSTRRKCAPDFQLLACVVTCHDGKAKDPHVVPGLADLLAQVDELGLVLAGFTPE